MRNERNFDRSQGVYQTRQRPAGNMGPENRFIANYKPGSTSRFVAPRSLVVGLILVIALLAFEIFNFDTTRYALQDLLGDVRFAGIGWASILAIAFCSIDFAGLAYLFSPERLRQESNEVWYLMGAWLLGATMNAMMTWWAVSLTLLNHNLGNEVLSREQLLYIVPIFVAVMVWLMRILFIGAFTLAGARLFVPESEHQPAAVAQARSQPAVAVSGQVAAGRTAVAVPHMSEVPHISEEVPAFLRNRQLVAIEAGQDNSLVDLHALMEAVVEQAESVNPGERRQRPSARRDESRPGGQPRMPMPMQARGRSRP
jgi:hypothetical protein